MPIKKDREAGFTLVELLCTLSILGIIISLAIPNLFSLSINTTYVQLRYQIISHLEEAQLMALAREVEVSVRFSSNGMITWSDGKRLQQIEFPENLQISSNYPENEVLFRETGQVRGGTVYIKQNNKNWMKVVIQVASGTTKVIVHV
jgi:prepilin-type N-terminal cleavage/methylation domain-containing protein